MRLEKIQKVLKEKNFPYTYTEEDGCGSIDFEYRGVVYHVWEFQDQDQWGADFRTRISGERRPMYGLLDAMKISWEIMRKRS